MLFFLFSALIVASDQLFKWWIMAQDAAGRFAIGTTPFIPGVLNLTYQGNTGIGWSIFADAARESELIRWALVAGSTIAVIVLVVVLVRYKMSLFGRLTLAAVLGGAVGNLIDRIITGSVTDMFQFAFWPAFPIFNIADVFISVGGVLFVLYFVKASFFPPKAQVEAEAARGGEAAAEKPRRARGEGTQPTAREVRVRRPEAAAERPAPGGQEDREIPGAFDLESILAEYRDEDKD